MSKLRTIALAGLETIKKEDGSIKHFSDTFFDNTQTYITDHKKDEDVVIIDARDFWKKPKPMSAIWERLTALSEDHPIDKLVISSHSGPTQLYFFSKIASARPELSEEERYFNQADSWDGIIFSEAAVLYLYGCQTAGMEGKRLDDCIAQSIADATGRACYGYVWKSSQKKGKDGGYRQLPEHGNFVKCIPNKSDSTVLDQAETK